MKKIIALILTLIMAAGLCACGDNNPETVTENFFTAVKEQNKDELLVYAENPAINILANNAGNEEEIKTIFDSITKNLAWEILSVEENEEKTQATVKVKITNADFSGVLATYQTEAVKYTTDNLASAEFTKEAMTQKCIEIFAQHVKAASEADTVKDTEIDIKLHKDEEGRWRLEMSEELKNAVLGGISFPQ